MSGAAKMENIIIHNASENNLKNITVSIPLYSFTCITGPSGSGKSSLIYDTLYAESQRNFLESMSGNLYGQKLMDKPNVEWIENLHPALNISQLYYNINPRSSVGTVTDISYYLRTLFALIISQEEDIQIDMSYFSPNNPLSCCEKCKGLGEEYYISENLVIPDESRTLSSGGILYYKGSKTSQSYKILESVCDFYQIDIDSKVSDLSQTQRHNLLYRDDDVEFKLRFKSAKGRYKQKTVHCKGALAELNDKLLDIDTPSTFTSISKYLDKRECGCCNGKRLKKAVLRHVISGENIADVESLSLLELQAWLQKVGKEYKHKLYFTQIEQLLTEVKNRIDCLIDLKLAYLHLSRSIPSLSGGEVQRVRLANQLTCSLSGVLYILDEPCKGLHYREIYAIIDASRRLIQKGSTVIAIEHNKQYVAAADKVIAMGPSGGPSGGYIISESDSPSSPHYEFNLKNSNIGNNYITLTNILYHNLKKVDLEIPVGCITLVTGVSGSGKSSIVSVLSECCKKNGALHCAKAEIPVRFSRVLHVNQQPIGKTPRSSVISYLGIYNEIRDLFSKCTDAKRLNLTASDFSMNVQGGRCECCQGTGKKKIELSYLPDSYITCPKCNGLRFKGEILSVRYNSNSITDVLDKPISDIATMFSDERILSPLRCMMDLGLGYISLGQMSMNLSGGEAQRIKLAKCLGAKVKGKSLYLLDEPTSGLNDEDIAKLSRKIEQLGKSGETVVIVEHNLEFASKVADYIVDLGCVAGDNGGTMLIQGKPKDVIVNRQSSWYGLMRR